MARRNLALTLFSEMTVFCVISLGLPPRADSYTMSKHREQDDMMENVLHKQNANDNRVLTHTNTWTLTFTQTQMHYIC